MGKLIYCMLALVGFGYVHAESPTLAIVYAEKYDIPGWDDFKNKRVAVDITKSIRDACEKKEKCWMCTVVNDDDTNFIAVQYLCIPPVTKLPTTVIKLISQFLGDDSQVGAVKVINPKSKKLFYCH